jgi:DNA-binding NtrC family response regulator
VTGLDLLRQIKARDANAQVVVATASATLDSAVEAINHGAFAYTHQTVRSPVRLRQRGRGAFEFRRLLLDNIHGGGQRRRETCWKKK